MLDLNQKNIWGGARIMELKVCTDSYLLITDNPRYKISLQEIFMDFLKFQSTIVPWSSVYVDDVIFWKPDNSEELVPCVVTNALGNDTNPFNERDQKACFKIRELHTGMSHNIRVYPVEKTHIYRLFNL